MISLNPFLLIESELGNSSRRVYSFITQLISDCRDSQEYLPKVQPCHVANNSLSLEAIKDRLAEGEFIFLSGRTPLHLCLVRGHLVTAPLEFLADQHDFTSDDSFDWRGLNPTLPIYI